MAELREIPFAFWKDKSGEVQQLWDEPKTHIATTSYGENAVEVRCSCSTPEKPSRWLVVAKRGVTLEDQLKQTFSAHLSYFSRKALGPD